MSLRHPVTRFTKERHPNQSYKSKNRSSPSKKLKPQIIYSLSRSVVKRKYMHIYYIHVGVFFCLVSYDNCLVSFDNWPWFPKISKQDTNKSRSVVKRHQTFVIRNQTFMKRHQTFVITNQTCMERHLHKTRHRVLC